MDFINCQNPNHDFQRIKYICVDSTCQAQKKIGCADCFLDDHSAHQRKTLEQFKEQVSQHIDSFNNIEFEPLSNQFDIVSSIDKELENCLDCIKYRVISIKQDLKSSLDGESDKLQESCLQQQKLIKQELESIKQIGDIHSIDQVEMNNLVRFYQESSKIQKEYTKSSELLKDEKQKIRLKKQKCMQKLKTIMQTLLKDFNDLMTTKNLQHDDLNDFETPIKQTMSPSKMLNFFETARSSRRFFTQHQKKLVFGNAAKKTD